MTLVLQLNDVGVARADATVLRGVSLQLDQGQSLAIVGCSGAGKSTLLRAIADLLDPAETLTGSVIRADTRPSWQVIGVVFQEPLASLDPLWTIGRLVAEPLRSLGVPRAQWHARSVRALEAAGFANAEHIAHLHPHELSGGMRQRVLLAVALVREPKILVLDEPTSALDAQAASGLLDDLERLRRDQGLTWIAATHAFAVAQAAQRVLVLEDGRPVSVGASVDVLADRSLPLVEAWHARTLPRTPPETSTLVLEALEVHLQHESHGRRLQVLRGASLQLYAGRITALVGASGCGKTSLVRVLLGLQSPSSGAVLYRDEQGVRHEWSRMREADRRPLRRAFGAVFQDPRGSLDPRQYVLESICEPMIVLDNLSAQAALTRALDLLRAVGLKPVLQSHLPHEMSGGERARIALCRAVAIQPRVLVLDEPTAALDPLARYEFARLVRRLVDERGMALLLVAHDPALVELLADEILELKDGRCRPLPLSLS